MDANVSKFTDFGVETVVDPDGKEIPKQDLYFLELENGYRYAVRGSGTEPKIKFYLFGSEPVADEGALETTKSKTRANLERLKEAILDDAKERSEN
jgi:phosphoglucomutase